MTELTDWIERDTKEHFHFTTVKCRFCSKEIEYIEDGYKPLTCLSYTCNHELLLKFLNICQEARRQGIAFNDSFWVWERKMARGEYNGTAIGSLSKSP
jgi:hypothetical protein